MARFYEAGSHCFNYEAFADCIEKRIDEEFGVVVVSIAEMQIADHREMDLMPPPPTRYRHPRQ